MAHLCLPLVVLLVSAGAAAAQNSNTPIQRRLDLEGINATRPLPKQETTGQTTGPTSPAPLRDEKTPDVTKPKLDQGND